MDALLEPPSDFALALPVTRRRAGSYYRVHQSRHGALYFDREPSYRFNSPAGKYGVLYMSEAPEGAFAEALLGGRSRPPTLSEAQLKTRALTAFEWRELALADFTGPGLMALGLDARIASADCYSLCRRWAAWIHAHPDNVDGICYFARNARHLRSRLAQGARPSARDRGPGPLGCFPSVTSLAFPRPRSGSGVATGVANALRFGMAHRLRILDDDAVLLETSLSKVVCEEATFWRAVKPLELGR